MGVQRTRKSLAVKSHRSASTGGTIEVTWTTKKYFNNKDYSPRCLKYCDRRRNA